MLRRGDRKARIRTSAAVIGVALIAVALGVAPVFEATSVRGALIGAGLLVLALRLVTLQLSFFRQGDRRWANRPRPEEQLGDRSAPDELRNPRFRAVWEHMDGVRRMMARREAEQLEREHEILGLTDDEQILFAGNRAAPLFWPIAIVSVAAVAASSLAVEIVTGWRAFALLGLGMSGMLYLVSTRDRVRYYLTTHRVLVRTRASIGRAATWAAVHYRGISDIEARHGPGGRRIVVSGEGVTAELTGLNRAQRVEIEAILDERLPAGMRGDLA
jgi:hypothetical protein